MNHHMLALRGIVAAGMLAVVASLAQAQEVNTTKVSEADCAVYARLRFARAIADEKGMFAHSDKDKQAVKAQLAKSFTDAGWTEDRYDQIDQAVSEGLGVLQESEQGEDPAAAKQQLAAMDKTTVATIKAHRKDLTDDSGMRQRARQQIQDEQAAARRGAPPTAAELAGKWVLDLDLTIAAMSEGLPDDLRKNVGDDLRKRLAGATYTFGPGDKLVATNQRPGQPPETDQGTYRLDGSRLIIKAKMGQRDRENGVDVGIKDGHLHIGMMGVYSVFRKE